MVLNMALFPERNTLQKFPECMPEPVPLCSKPCTPGHCSSSFVGQRSNLDQVPKPKENTLKFKLTVRDADRYILNCPLSVR